MNKEELQAKLAKANAENKGMVTIIICMDWAVGLSGSGLGCWPCISFVLSHWVRAARIGMLHARDGAQPGASAIFKPQKVFIRSITLAFSAITLEIAGNSPSNSCHWAVVNL